MPTVGVVSPAYTLLMSDKNKSVQPGSSALSPTSTVSSQRLILSPAPSCEREERNRKTKHSPRSVPSPPLSPAPPESSPSAAHSSSSSPSSVPSHPRTSRSEEHQHQKNTKAHREEAHHQYTPADAEAEADVDTDEESSGKSRTLYVGGLDQSHDEARLRTLFPQCVSVRIMYDPSAQHRFGYAFVRFATSEAAASALELWSQHPQLTAADRQLKINWGQKDLKPSQSETSAPASSQHTLSSDGEPVYSLFVGDLAQEVTGEILEDLFRSKYSSICEVRVMMDTHTGHCKGYGFVRFKDEQESNAALVEMNRCPCAGRPIRIDRATPRRNQRQLFRRSLSQSGDTFSDSSDIGEASSQESDDASDPTNCVIFVGGLDGTSTEEDLECTFGVYGELLNIKVLHGRGCGFVEFAERSTAEHALRSLHNQVIGTARVRLSWGRSMSRRPHPRSSYAHARAVSSAPDRSMVPDDPTSATLRHAPSRAHSLSSPTHIQHPAPHLHPHHSHHPHPQQPHQQSSLSHSGGGVTPFSYPPYFPGYMYPGPAPNPAYPAYPMYQQYPTAVPPSGIAYAPDGTPTTMYAGSHPLSVDAQYALDAQYAAASYMQAYAAAAAVAASASPNSSPQQVRRTQSASESSHHSSAAGSLPGYPTPSNLSRSPPSSDGNQQESQAAHAHMAMAGAPGTYSWASYGGMPPAAANPGALPYMMSGTDPTVYYAALYGVSPAASPAYAARPAALVEAHPESISTAGNPPATATSTTADGSGS